MSGENGSVVINDSNKRESSGLVPVLIIVLILVMLGSCFFIYRLVSATPLESEEQVTLVGPIFETEEFIVNLSGSMNRYVKAQFALELSNEEVQLELTEKLPLLKDAIIMILSDQTADVLNIQGKENLKVHLLESINQFLDKGEVIKIHFLVLLLS